MHVINNYVYNYVIVKYFNYCIISDLYQIKISCWLEMRNRLALSLNLFKKKKILNKCNKYSALKAHSCQDFQTNFFQKLYLK